MMRPAPPSGAAPEHHVVVLPGRRCLGSTARQRCRFFPGEFPYHSRRRASSHALPPLLLLPISYAGEQIRKDLEKHIESEKIAIQEETYLHSLPATMVSIDLTSSRHSINRSIHQSAGLFTCSVVSVLTFDRIGRRCIVLTRPPSTQNGGIALPAAVYGSVQSSYMMLLNRLSVGYALRDFSLPMAFRLSMFACCFFIISCWCADQSALESSSISCTAYTYPTIVLPLLHNPHPWRWCGHCCGI